MRTVLSQVFKYGAAFKTKAIKMDIAAAIAMVTQGLGIARTLRTIEKNFDEATYKAQIAEVIEALTDAKLALADAKENMAERDKEIERLKANFQLRANLVSDRGDYKYIANDAGQPLGYPICPKCEVLDGRIVQLKQDGGMIHGRCPACSTKFSPVTAYLTQQEREQREAEKRAEEARAAENLGELGSKLA
jgi:hypothetical protein